MPIPSINKCSPQRKIIQKSLPTTSRRSASSRVTSNTSNSSKTRHAAKRDYLDSHIGAVGNVGNIDQAISNAGGFDYQPGRAQTAVGYDEANKAQAQKDLDNYQKGQGAPPTTVGGLRTDATGAAGRQFPAGID